MRSQSGSDLTAEGHAAAKPHIGTMIEVPSAAYIIAELASRVDFFSIGTNDLTQCLLAVDRSNPLVQGRHDNLHPAVVHFVGDIVQRAHRQNKPVGVCGEMAGDPASALLLIGLGVDSLSMTPSSLPRVKWTIIVCDQAQDTRICSATYRRGPEPPPDIENQLIPFAFSVIVS